MKNLKILIFCLICIGVFAIEEKLDENGRPRRFNYLTAEQIASLGPLEPFDNKVKLGMECNTKLLQAFHLFGRTTAMPTSLEFCPDVEMSCCTKADQLIIYDNWFTEGEKNLLDKKLERVERTLHRFFEEANKVNGWAAKVIAAMDGLPNNECKLMARRILTYQVPEMEDSLMKKFHESFNFAKQTFEGIYCTICDAENHKYFDLTAKKLKVSEQFCRSVITNNLSQMMYFRIHIPKFANLLSTFIGTCDQTGKFVQEKIPKDVLHEIKEDDEESLKQCFEARNTPLWLNECQEICQDWQIDALSDDYLPDLEVLNEIIKFVDLKEDKFDDERKAFGRVLEESQDLKETKKLKRSYVRRTSSKDSKKNRRLQNTNSDQNNQNNQTNQNDQDDRESQNKPRSNYRKEEALWTDEERNNPLIRQYMNRTNPRGTDERGYPRNVTNFTNAGLNKTASEYVAYLENEFELERTRKQPDEEEPENVYISMNKTVGINLMDWSIVVQKNGTDLYREGQFTNIEFESLLKLVPPDSEPRGLRERRNIALKMNLEEQSEIEEARAELTAQSTERKLSSANLFSSLTIVGVLLGIRLY